MAVLSNRNFSLWMAKMKRKIQVADISSLLKRKAYVRPLRKMRSFFILSNYKEKSIFRALKIWDYQG